MTLHRPELDLLQQHGLEFSQPWQIVDYFEKTVAEFFGAPYAVATDCCTHALELCLHLIDHRAPVTLPRHTYMSVPMMLDKIGVPYQLKQQNWSGWYDVVPGRVIDAATLWEPGSYISNTMMCVSFQFKKHINIGRGGIILLDNELDYQRLQRMVRDGRDRTLTQFEDNVTELGYHYYMTPEDAARGILLFLDRGNIVGRRWNQDDYRDLTEMDYFYNKTTNK